MTKPKPKNTAEEILARIDRRREALKAAGHKHSDRHISMAATGSPYTLASIRKGIADGTQTGISTETLKKLAFPLATTTEFLLTGQGLEDVDDPGEDAPHVESSQILVDSHEPQGVPLIGYVSAGAQAVMIPLPAGELDRVPRPPGASEKTVALEIRGDSLGAVFDRWLVFYDDIRSPVTPDLIGKLCVVGLPDGRVLVKKIRVGRNGAFDLLSNTEEPIAGVEIHWAAAVKNMGPR